MFEDDLNSARNLKNLLCIFEHLSGLKINFLKSEIFCFGKARDRNDDYMSIFTWSKGVLPFKYLGMSLHDRKIRNSDRKHTEDKVEKNIDSLQGRLQSYGGRLILLVSCFSNDPLYMMSLVSLPKCPCKRMDFFRKRLLWQEKGVKKYHLVKWEEVCPPKELGGLGVVDLKIMNICLLTKWL